MITQKELKSLLGYNYETGVFTWMISPSRGVKTGDIAGCLRESDGYIIIRISGKSYYAHRLAWVYMTGEWPEYQIDHDDHIRHNNKWDNLNAATSQENGKNKSKNRRNKSGVTGVNWFKGSEKWIAQIQTDSKKEYLGLFEDKFEAICKRKSAELDHGFHRNHGA